MTDTLSVDSLTDETCRAIGMKIKETREAKGLSIRDLSTLCDINISNLSRIEAGRLNPTITTLVRICAPLGIVINFTKAFK